MRVSWGEGALEQGGVEWKKIWTAEPVSGLGRRGSRRRTRGDAHDHTGTATTESSSNTDKRGEMEQIIERHFQSRKWLLGAAILFIIIDTPTQLR